MAGVEERATAIEGHIYSQGSLHFFHRNVLGLSCSAFPGWGADDGLVLDPQGSPDTIYILPDSLDLIPSWSMGWLDRE